MTKVMFVCLGNICRSPMAEAMFKHIVRQEAKDKKYLIDSSGTSAYHIGSAPDSRMRATARQHSVEMNHAAKQFKKEHFQQFDHIIAMDESNYRNMIRLTQNDQHRKKVRLMRDFDLSVDGSPEVPDPYYGGDEGFEEVYQIVKRSCEELFKQLEE